MLWKTLMEAAAGLFKSSAKSLLQLPNTVIFRISLKRTNSGRITVAVQYNIERNTNKVSFFSLEIRVTC
jgi:hypothetical protein